MVQTHKTTGDRLILSPVHLIGWDCARVTPVINPRRACAARVTVLGLCVCVCLRLFSHYRQRGGLWAIPTAQYNKRSKIKVVILLLSLYLVILSLSFVHLVSGPSASKFWTVNGLVMLCQFPYHISCAVLLRKTCAPDTSVYYHFVIVQLIGWVVYHACRVLCVTLSARHSVPT